MKVPTGAWQRDWIHRQGGAEDRSTVVRYVQTPSMFSDVRIRRDRPPVGGATSFAELSDAQLAGLAEQNGFAGFTTMAGADATWHHEIDFQPTDGGVDVGRIVAANPPDDGVMFEHALDDAYVERWSRLAPDPGAYIAVQLVCNGHLDQLFVVAAGHFAYARARAQPLPPCTSITELIARSHPSRETLYGYLDCELAFGAAHSWRVERSTLPWHEGHRLAFVDQLAVEAGALVVRAPPEVRWSVAVNTLPARELAALFAVR